MSTPNPITACASFEDEWNATRYLSDYYADVQNDEQVTMHFLADAAAFIGDVPLLLEFGCGPTVHHLFPFAARAAEIHVADYLQSNLDAVHAWIEARAHAHDWSAFATYALRRELGRAPTATEVMVREELTRGRITELHLADARRTRPLQMIEQRRYPAVLCCFCPDSITDDLDEWRQCTSNVASLVEPGGWLVLAALRRAASYRVGSVNFPSAGVSERDLAGVLHSAGFSQLGTTIASAHTRDDSGHGFESVMLAVSRKP